MDGNWWFSTGSSTQSSQNFPKQLIETIWTKNNYFFPSNDQDKCFLFELVGPSIGKLLYKEFDLILHGVRDRNTNHEYLEIEEFSKKYNFHVASLIPLENNDMKANKVIDQLVKFNLSSAVASHRGFVV